ncbi:MAG: 50S ribosomal protein L35 [Candidatus Magasanikbacteria bacterium CG11_big_fil_rev_8_21_14_0_20_43_7]|uniref:Large ribosomal subunit protein bL35 n=1 Tax=Candidatus Magasanikbacteria bacterium CG11_big_fil_rev_8_21_14_0_20_43_7 TaxID=1974654 RepID=A0A2H0N5M2_9BACT|nr:MAG: 50S ribosomal protein L35 [Candidatus Magasanikbacteria bacterium CG11_big_fil_rev_8_21_14_0_20_43_7]
MPKIKTKKSISKRFKLTKTGKILKRADGQDHFNARQTGKKKRNKRSDNTLTVTGLQRTIVRSLP